MSLPKPEERLAIKAHADNVRQEADRFTQEQYRKQQRDKELREAALLLELVTSKTKILIEKVRSAVAAGKKYTYVTVDREDVGQGVIAQLSGGDYTFKLDHVTETVSGGYRDYGEPLPDFNKQFLAVVVTWP